MTFVGVDSRSERRRPRWAGPLSTVSREPSRSTPSTTGFLPHAAHRASVARRHRPRQAEVLAHPPLGEYVQARLSRSWVPQQISNRLGKDYPDCPSGRSAPRRSTRRSTSRHAAGSNGICSRVCGACAVAASPTGRPTAAGPVSSTARRRSPSGPPRSRAAAPRGHWEEDLIVSRKAKSAVATLIERTSRFVVLGHPGAARDADTVRDSLVIVVGDLPARLRRSLTWDQGAEMAEHVPLRGDHDAGLLLRPRLALAARQRGSAAATRTPTDSCASTSRRAGPTTLRPRRPSRTS